MKTNIIITTSFPAIHCWPECNIFNKKYLKNPHRHLFQIKVKIKIQHHNRQIEFLTAKDFIDRIIKDDLNWYNKNIGFLSCEMMCKTLYGKLVKSYGKNNVVYISVMEDGENGAEVYA